MDLSIHREFQVENHDAVSEPRPLILPIPNFRTRRSLSSPAAKFSESFFLGSRTVQDSHVETSASENLGGENCVVVRISLRQAAVGFGVDCAMGVWGFEQARMVDDAAPVRDTGRTGERMDHLQWELVRSSVTAR